MKVKASTRPWCRHSTTNTLTSKFQFASQVLCKLISKAIYTPKRCTFPRLSLTLSMRFKAKVLHACTEHCWKKLLKHPKFGLCWPQNWRLRLKFKLSVDLYKQKLPIHLSWFMCGFSKFKLLYYEFAFFRYVYNIYYKWFLYLCCHIFVNFWEIPQKIILSFFKQLVWQSYIWQLTYRNISQLSLWLIYIYVQIRSLKYANYIKPQ